VGSSPKISGSNFCIYFSFPPAWYMPFPSHPSWFNYPNYSRWRVHIIKLLFKLTYRTFSIIECIDLSLNVSKTYSWSTVVRIPTANQLYLLRHFVVFLRLCKFRDSILQISHDRFFCISPTRTCYRSYKTPVVDAQSWNNLTKQATFFSPSCKEGWT